MTLKMFKKYNVKFCVAYLDPFARRKKQPNNNKLEKCTFFDWSENMILKVKKDSTNRRSYPFFKDGIKGIVEKNQSKIQLL
ncbi:hypothetical protein GCM10020331_000870 [Ectobacillus funiculus]